MSIRVSVYLKHAQPQLCTEIFPNNKKKKKEAKITTMT